MGSETVILQKEGRLVRDADLKPSYGMKYGTMKTVWNLKGCMTAGSLMLGC